MDVHDRAEVISLDSRREPPKVEGEGLERVNPAFVPGQCCKHERVIAAVRAHIKADPAGSYRIRHGGHEGSLIHPPGHATAWGSVQPVAAKDPLLHLSPRRRSSPAPPHGAHDVHHNGRQEALCKISQRSAAVGRAAGALSDQVKDLARSRGHRRAAGDPHQGSLTPQTHPGVLGTRCEVCEKRLGDLRITDWA